jgi:hypothetical protein
MPTVAEFATDLKSASRRLARTVPAVLDASFHPFRTVREGTRLVQGLLAPEHDEPVPPPTEAAAPADTVDHTPIHRQVAKPAPPAPPAAPEPDLLPDPGLDDHPIHSRGPAPHVPPAIAAEVERDYGDEIPGITTGE